jgi:geranylgeranyl pyrophosphate synthase
MRDDLLDWIPNKEGKTKMSDIQEGNQTVVMTTCREEYSEDAWNRLRENK